MKYVIIELHHDYYKPRHGACRCCGLEERNKFYEKIISIHTCPYDALTKAEEMSKTIHDLPVMWLYDSRPSFRKSICVRAMEE